MTDSVIRSRIDADLKAEAVQVLSSMGLTMSEAIRLFLTQTVAYGGLPFAVKMPNATTIGAMQDALMGEFEAVTLEQLAKECGK
jgi:DNA-damage-inducible protein J